MKVVRKNYLLLPRRATEIVECVRKYMDGISQNLQSLSSYKPDHPTVFLFLRMIVKQVKSSTNTSRYQLVNRY